MRFRFVLLVFLLPIFLFAQKPGHAPFFKTFDPQKLAHALTDGCQTDSEKVKSIYLWMTRHIRYDVKGFSSGGGSYTSPRAILFFRKAVCIGISILFDSLCEISGVNAHVVPGYVYEPWYEARDTIYLDSHAWNVVQVEGEWKLLDITWAGGIVKTKRQPIRKLMFRFFHIPYRQKLVYRRRRNDAYYFTPPEKFVLDHLPSAPAWQLLPCSVPIDSFQWSPHAVQNYLDDPVNCHNGNDSIDAIDKAGKNREMIAEGKQAVHFNKHNHQDLSLGYWLNAFHYFEMAEDTNLSYPDRMAYFDSVAVQMDSAGKMFAATSKDCRQEADYFVRRNKRMKQQVTMENKPLIKKKAGEVARIKKEKVNAKKTIRKLQAQNRKLKLSSKKIKRNKIDIKRPDKPNEKEAEMREKLEDKIHDNEDAIHDYEDSISFVTYNLLGNEPHDYVQQLKVKRKIMKLELGAQDLTNLYREYELNSFDTLVMRQKEKIFRYEFQLDSVQALIRQPGNWQTDSMAALYAGYVAKMDVLMKQNLQYYKQLGKMSAGGTNEKEAFRDTKKKYIAWNDSMIAQNNLRIKGYGKYLDALDRQEFFYSESKDGFTEELKLEDMRVMSTNGFFKAYYGGNAKMMKNNVSQCKRLHDYAVKRKKQLEAEQAKKQKLAQAKKPQKKNSN